MHVPKNIVELVVERPFEGIEIDAVLDEILYGRLREYITKEC